MSFPASISDRILITLTDPAGFSVSFEKSKFTAPDGTTGIGPGGGTVEGPGGVELRIPEGALEQGVTLQIESFDENFLPPDQKPDLPNSNFGAGLKATSEDILCPTRYRARESRVGPSFRCQSSPLARSWRIFMGFERDYTTRSSSLHAARGWGVAHHYI